MQFGPVPTPTACGAILAHSLRVGARTFKKGRVLSADDVEALTSSGYREVTVARLEQTDIAEDRAAARIAAALAGSNIRIGAAFTGRANLYAERRGLAIVDADRIAKLNSVDETVTAATVAPFALVESGQMVATVKIIPFAVSGIALDVADNLLRGHTALRVAPFVPKRVALVSTMFAGTKPALLDKNRAAQDARLEPLGSMIVSEQRVAHDTALLAEALIKARETTDDIILVFGASAITDRRDVIPAAIERAGGQVTHFGMPVDPGNLLLLGNLRGAIVIGLPGCARSPKTNGFDFVLRRVLADIPVDSQDIAAMGVGGLLGEIHSRPQLRDHNHASFPRAHKVAAVILAAGLSSRMGSNKLLAKIAGKPLVRGVAEAALGSAARPVIVVVGHGADDTRNALAGLPVSFVENRDFRKGLSTSLICGVNAVPEDCDAALILLGDMPGINSDLLDRMIAAFSPDDDRAICVATHAGKRGNPVLWARQFFPEIRLLEGDIGAKSLVTANEELVSEVESRDDSPLVDIDTPQALAAYVGQNR